MEKCQVNFEPPCMKIDLDFVHNVMIHFLLARKDSVHFEIGFCVDCIRQQNCHHARVIVLSAIRRMDDIVTYELV